MFSLFLLLLNLLVLLFNVFIDWFAPEEEVFTFFSVVFNFLKSPSNPFTDVPAFFTLLLTLEKELLKFFILLPALILIDFTAFPNFPIPFVIANMGPNKALKPTVRGVIAAPIAAIVIIMLASLEFSETQEAIIPIIFAKTSKTGSSAVFKSEMACLN